MNENSKMTERNLLQLECFGNYKKLNILIVLQENKTMIANDIHRAVKITQSDCGTHLGKLRKVGLVYNMKDGRNAYYSINYDVFDELLSNLLADFKTT